MGKNPASAIHLVQSIADDKFGSETFDQLPSFSNPDIPRL